MATVVAGVAAYWALVQAERTIEDLKFSEQAVQQVHLMYICIYLYIYLYLCIYVFIQAVWAIEDLKISEQALQQVQLIRSLFIQSHANPNMVVVLS